MGSKKASLFRTIDTCHDESVLVAGRFRLEGNLWSLLGVYNKYNPIQRQTGRHTTKRGNEVFLKVSRHCSLHGKKKKDHSRKKYRPFFFTLVGKIEGKGKPTKKDREKRVFDGNNEIVWSWCSIFLLPLFVGKNQESKVKYLQRRVCCRERLHCWIRS